ERAAPDGEELGDRREGPLVRQGLLRVLRVGGRDGAASKRHERHAGDGRDAREEREEREERSSHPHGGVPPSSSVTHTCPGELVPWGSKWQVEQGPFGSTVPVPPMRVCMRVICPPVPVTVTWIGKVGSYWPGVA